MAFSQDIYNAIDKYFIDDNAKYEANEDKGYFTARYSLGDSCSISAAELLVLIHKDGFTMRFAIAGIKAAEGDRKVVCELLTYINDGMRYGNFEMDMDDGEVAFKISNIIPVNGELNYEYLDRCVCLGLHMIEQYSSALCPIILGLTTDAAGLCASCEED